MHIKLLPWTNGARLSVQLFGIFQRNSSMIQTGIHRNSSKFGYVSGLFDASIKLIVTFAVPWLSYQRGWWV